MLHVVMWAAIAGWVSPLVLTLVAAAVLRLSPRLRAWLLDRHH